MKVALPFSTVTLLGLVFLFVFSGSSRGGEVPLAWCYATGSNCPNVEPYNGPTPADWGMAAYLGAHRYAAAHVAQGFCTCDGTVCSTLSTWDLLTQVPSGMEGGNYATGNTSLAAVDVNGHAWGSSYAMPECGCPTNAVLDTGGVCHCQAGTVWDGGQCVVPASCGQGSSSYLDLCSPPAVLPKNRGKACTGNPCNPGTGLKVQREVFYSAGLLKFEGVYNSHPVGSPLPYEPNVLGKEWTFNYGTRIASLSANKVSVTRSDGAMLEFRPPTSGLIYLSDQDVSDRLEKLVDSQNNLTGWRYTVAADDAVEAYSANGALLSITYRNGQSVVLTYSDANTPISIAYAPGLVIRVTDSFGNVVNFSYDQQGRIRQFLDPTGGTYVLAYDESSSFVLSGQAAIGNLTSITFPGGAKRIYYYNEQTYTSGANLASALTGIADESTARYSIYQYDASGRVISTEHVGAAEKYQISYDTAYQQSTVTDPLGQSRAYRYSVVQGVVKPIGISAPCGNCGISSSQSYDTNGNIASKTDFNGNVTTYQYDLSRNLETSRTEASGTSQARTITTSWHPSYRLPTLISVYTGNSATGTPIRTTVFTYDSSGNQLTKTITDPALSLSRPWVYTYTNYGQVLTADGPRTDVSDVTTYTYYTCATGYQCGQVQTITNALGQVTTYNTYNAAGQPLTLTDPNGMVTTLTYDARQRLATRTVGGQTTTFAYFPTGQLQKVTPPNGSYLQYSYDAAHRLTQIQDTDGNKVVYTLDAAGNHTAENLYDPNGALKRTHTKVFNSLSQLYQDINAANTAAVTTQYGYDNNGNQTTINAPLTRNTSNQYDALNRLIQVTDPAGGIAHYGYDANDNLVSVTDPRGLVTSYTFNGLGDLISQTSPDTGTTLMTYDSAGNLKTRTDARGQVTTFQYDALNRITQMATADQTLNYQYDQGTNGISHLTTVSDANQTTTFAYDPQGHVIQKSQTQGSITHTTQYAYTNGDLTQETTPSGQVIVYSYTNGKVTGIALNGATVLNQIQYDPFGPLKQWTWGNGSITQRTFDQDGYLTSNQSAGTSTYTFNPDGSIASQTNDSSVNLNLPKGLTTLNVASTSNRLSSTTGVLTRTDTFDAAGNLTSDGTRTFTFNGAGRMTSATNAGVMTNYVYNALGQRIKKTNTNGTTVLSFDEQGHLLGEFTGANVLIAETIWLGDIPVASIRTNDSGNGVGIFYIHTDHLNAPQKLTRATDGVTVWRLDRDPYGNGTPNQDPDGNGLIVQMNQRASWQYADSETNLNQNWNRDCYDPQTGNYCQSDPIGLDGGSMSTYSYANNNPISNIDPDGLAATVPTPGIPAGPLPLVIPPMAIPGTPENKTWTKAASQAMSELAKLFDRQHSESCESDRDREKRCEENLSRDLATCTALGKRNGKQAYAVCAQQAMLRYGNCLSGRDSGINAPLPPWGK